MILYRLNEVPDPDGLLDDLLGELLDNSVLVPMGDCVVVERGSIEAGEYDVVRVGDDPESLLLEWWPTSPTSPFATHVVVPLPSWVSEEGAER